MSTFPVEHLVSMTALISLSLLQQMHLQAEQHVKEQ
jgi:hypothetical protein